MSNASGSVPPEPSDLDSDSHSSGSVPPEPSDLDSDLYSLWLLSVDELTATDESHSNPHSLFTFAAGRRRPPPSISSGDNAGIPLTMLWYTDPPPETHRPSAGKSSSAQTLCRNKRRHHMVRTHYK